MWLQTMWFLVRARDTATLVLDEPDVYMHADLQRKLIRTVRDLTSQIIVTTHSTEIMSEVAPEDILVIDKRHPESKRADSLPAVQAVLARLGSAQNIHLFRLWNAKRFILIEGDDLRLLQGFQNVILPESAVPIAAIPNSSFGGWGGWSYALGSSMALANAAGSEIVTYCFLDSDYHNQSQVDHVYREFARYGGQVHVWCKKEIENYLLSPTAITKAIVSKLPRRASLPTEAEIDAKMNEFANALKDEMFDAVAQEFLSLNRGLGVAGANKLARTAIDARIQAAGLLSCVSGKAVIQRLFSWVQREFGASMNTLTICRQFTASEIDPEMKGVLLAIENAEAFPVRSQAAY
jgi:energy-coupling factor transporter ATP-binding protein EcfA2